MSCIPRRRDDTVLLERKRWNADGLVTAVNGSGGHGWPTAAASVPERLRLFRNPSGDTRAKRLRGGFGIGSVAVFSPLYFGQLSLPTKLGSIRLVYVPSFRFGSFTFRPFGSARFGSVYSVRFDSVRFSSIPFSSIRFGSDQWNSFRINLFDSFTFYRLVHVLFFPCWAHCRAAGRGDLVREDRVVRPPNHREPDGRVQHRQEPCRLGHGRQHRRFQRSRRQCRCCPSFCCRLFWGGAIMVQYIRSL